MMSKPTNLVPNLNEIMEEYVEWENETVQATQAVTEQNEERGKVNIMFEPMEEESRKRKMRTEGTEIEQRAEKVRNFILDKAVALMEKSLKERGFIAERGFKKLVSPFVEMLENREWQALGEHKEPGCTTMVKEFFANMVEEGKKVYVRGHWIDFNKERMNMLFNLKMQKDSSKFKKLLKEPDYQKIVDLLTAEKGKWKGTKKTLYKSISRGDLTEEAKVWFYFITSVLLPSKHLSTVKRDEAILLYGTFFMLKGYKINVGEIIEKSILSYSISNCRGLIPHPATITSLCLLGGVEVEWEKEETYPRTSPLKLTGVTNGPKNRGNEKEKDMEEERGSRRCHELAQ